MRFADWVAQFGTKYQQYLDELGEMGENTAREMFAAAPGDDGNTDVTVSRMPGDTGNFTILATGHDAMFMEFGTGVSTEIKRPTVQSDIDISDGSWSKEALATGDPPGGGEYAKYNDYWHWNGEHWTGTPALGGMQEACNAMEQQSPTIARRVFG